MKIVKKNKTYFLNVDNLEEERNLEQYLNKVLDVNRISVNEVLFSLREKTEEKTIEKPKVYEKEKVIEKEKPLIKPSSIIKTSFKDAKDLVKNKIATLLNDKNLTFQDKVEGSFETLLNKEDLSVFKEMLLNKEVEVFKLSDKYKKGVYQMASFNKPSSLPSKEQTADFSFFDTEKYIILNKPEDAKQFSSSYEAQIKAGDILGIKSFDGNYYVINKLLFTKIRDLIFSLNLKDSFSIDFLIEKTTFQKQALKVVIEILKEEGLIIEKRKETYQLL